MLIMPVGSVLGSNGLVKDEEHTDLSATLNLLHLEVAHYLDLDRGSSNFCFMSHRQYARHSWHSNVRKIVFIFYLSHGYYYRDWTKHLHTSYNGTLLEYSPTPQVYSAINH